MLESGEDLQNYGNKISASVDSFLSISLREHKAQALASARVCEEICELDTLLAEAESLFEQYSSRLESASSLLRTLLEESHTAT